MLRAAIGRDLGSQGKLVVFGDIVRALNSLTPFDAAFSTASAAQASPGWYKLHSGFLKRTGSVGFRTVVLKTLETHEYHKELPASAKISRK